MKNKVFVTNCENYSSEFINNAYKELLLDSNLLDFVKPNMKIAIKVNLVDGSKEQRACTTNIHLVYELCKILISLGAIVTVGDSCGGLFNSQTLNSIYKKTGIDIVLETGAKLNQDFTYKKVKYDGFIVKELDCSNWLLDSDAIINFAKLKTHGMMSLSATTKNMFGSVPGTIKFQYHYKYNNHEKFSKMLIDIQEFYEVKLHILDGIMAMEGNGPTQGKPRHVGMLLASKSCYDLDIVASKLINLDICNVPTIQEAINLNLSSSNYNEVEISKDVTNYIVSDFDNIIHKDTIKFYQDKSNSIVKRFIGKIASKALESKPIANNNCIGCGKCMDICPQKAIQIKNKHAIINRRKCIKCFCCQEFCPIGSMIVKKTLITKLLTPRHENNK